MNTIPSKPAFTTRPDEANTVAYGKYLVTAASCVECHSKRIKGELVPGKEFAGGNTFEFPGGTVASANITPHKTGIGNLSKEAFIARFKMYSDPNYTSPVLNVNDYNTPMPWTYFAHMKETDLAAIYDYLRTVKPVENNVVKFVKKANK
jgi:mono/diheme cytochrome c family protein